MKPAWLQKKPLSFLYRLILFLTWCFFKLVYRHRVYGLEHFYDGSAIIAGNHASFFDPPILAISWPEEVHFLAREGLFKNPLFGGLIRKLNAHPVSGDAGDIAVFKTVCRLLEEGRKVILFPEGTRCFTDALDVPLKPGIAVLVSRARSAVVPAYIHGTYQIWGRKRSFPKLWGKTACVFGSPLKWSDFAHLDKKEGQRMLLDQLAIRMNALRTWYLAGAKGTPP
jgi:1-acyl-sn-glycerol-3-phosphate acyltransferase